jgi:hypothetical protein
MASERKAKPADTKLFTKGFRIRPEAAKQLKKLGSGEAVRLVHGGKLGRWVNPLPTWLDEMPHGPMDSATRGAVFSVPKRPEDHAERKTAQHVICSRIERMRSRWEGESRGRCGSTICCAIAFFVACFSVFRRCSRV